MDSPSASARMNNYEKGRHEPDFNMAKNIAEQLDVPVAYFYCENDEMAELILAFDKLSPKQRKLALAEILRLTLSIT